MAHASVGTYPRVLEPAPWEAEAFRGLRKCDRDEFMKAYGELANRVGAQLDGARSGSERNEIIARGQLQNRFLGLALEEVSGLFERREYIIRVVLPSIVEDLEPNVGPLGG